MTLRELEARFMRVSSTDPDGRVRTLQEVDKIEHAQGVQFLCPVCFAKNNGPVGTHQVLCWSRSRGTPDTASPGPGRWALHGTSIDDLTLNPDPPSQNRSVQLNGGCNAHFFVTNGKIANA